MIHMVKKHEILFRLDLRLTIRLNLFYYDVLCNYIWENEINCFSLHTKKT